VGPPVTDTVPAGQPSEAGQAERPSGAAPAGQPSGVARLVAVMDRLRGPGGCPWDAAQTHGSLARYLLEETHELLEALDTGDRVLLREELGDLLLQVVFHARIAAEDPGSPFDLDDVAADVAAKLVRRHPHVYPPEPAGPLLDPGPGPVGDPGVTVASLVDGWEQRKRAEKGRRTLFEGIPTTIPALLLATKMLDRIAASGLAVAPVAAVLPVAAAPGVLPPGHRDDEPAGQPPDEAPTGVQVERVVGDTLLGVAAAARDAGVDPEQALRSALRRLGSAVALAETGSGAGPDTGAGRAELPTGSTDPETATGPAELPTGSTG